MFSTKSLSEHREKRYATPPEVRLPGLDISELSTEQLELLLSLGLDSNPHTKAWKIRAAHKLATRFIKGDKSPINDAKAYSYAEMEINTLSIEELESKFFQIKTDHDNHVSIVTAWQNEKAENTNADFQFSDRKSIRAFIDQAKWNDALKAEKQESAHAVLLAWEKQLAAKRLAEHYKNKCALNRTLSSHTTAIFYQEIEQYLKDHEKPSTTPQWLITLFSWFNSIRLATIRLNKTLTQFNAPFLVKPLLKWAASIAGLYFLLELIVDSGILIKAALFNWKGEFDPSLTRLKATFWDDNRPSRMMNALIWFSINFTCLMLTVLLGPAAPLVAAFWCGVLTVGGCIFDVGAEVAIGLYANRNQQGVLQAITEDNKSADPATKQKQESALQLIGDQLSEKRKALIINRAYTIGIMMILLVCAGFLFFPPAGLALAPMIAGCAALVIGSVFGGLGKRLFWSAPGYFNQVKNFTLGLIDSIKEKISPTIKEKPILAGSHSCPDDWNCYRRVNHELTSNNSTENANRTKTDTDAEKKALAKTSTLTRDDMDDIKKIKQHCRNSSLHRSRSGDLFTCALSASPKPIQSNTSTSTRKLT